MFKKYKLVAALCVVGIVSGFTTHTADASASVGGEEQGQQQAQTPEQEKDSNHNYGDLESFLEKCLAKWNISWDEGTDKPVKPEEDQQTPEPDVDQPAPAPQPEDKPEAEKPAEDNQNDSQSDELSQFEQQVVELTNQERAKQGLSALKIDNELSKVASEKSRDMQINNYFDHNSPTYGSPFDMMEAYGIDYRSAGENIAKGQRTPEEVVNGWMNSEGHRANILNSSFTHIGVGYNEQGNIWTQQFIGK